MILGVAKSNIISIYIDTMMIDDKIAHHVLLSRSASIRYCCPKLLDERLHAGRLGQNHMQNLPKGGGTVPLRERRGRPDIFFIFGTK